MAILKAHRHLEGPYVFCDEAGKRLTHSKVKRVVPRICADTMRIPAKPIARSGRCRSPIPAKAITRA